MKKRPEEGHSKQLHFFLAKIVKFDPLSRAPVGKQSVHDTHAANVVLGIDLDLAGQGLQRVQGLALLLGQLLVE